MSKQPTDSPPTAQPSDNSSDNSVAGAGIRLLAVLYDGMLILAMLFLVALILVVIGTIALDMGGTQASDARAFPLWYQNLVLSPSFVLTLVGFYGVFWRKSGQTLGMQTWRLKTITSDGQLLTWTQSFVRILCACLAPMVCAMVGYLLYHHRQAVLLSGILGFVFNYLFCLVHSKGLALHDLLSNTTTIKVAKIAHTPLLAGLFKK